MLIEIYCVNANTIYFFTLLSVARENCIYADNIAFEFACQSCEGYVITEYSAISLLC